MGRSALGLAFRAAAIVVSVVSDSTVSAQNTAPPPLQGSAPETKEAFEEIGRFFSRHLGR